MCSYEWQPICRNDALPGGAVFAGRTSTDGDVYVARVGHQCGKLNLHDGRMHNIWCHDGGSSQTGDVLVVVNGGAENWVRAKRGDALPAGAVVAGSTDTDGENFPCRNSSGECGKVNLKDGRVNNFWYHGYFFAKGEGEILVVSDAGDAGHGKGKGKGSGEGHVPVPAPEPHAGGHGKGGGRGPAGGGWNPDVLCDGARAEERVQWLCEHHGLSVEAAREQVMREFPHTFADWWRPGASCDGIPAEERMRWLMENEGFSEGAARLKVKSEFPAVFGAGGGDFIAARFPHTLSLVDTAEGPKLQFEVVASGSNVTLVAVHYQINGGQPMNFDIPAPEAGSRTFVHVTPHGWGYPACHEGDSVSYWLAEVVDGLIAEEPEGACTHEERRLTWQAHY